MKEKLYILTFGLLMIGCETKSPNQNSTEAILKSDTTGITIMTQEVDENSEEVEKAGIEECMCSDFDNYKNFDNLKTELIFNNHNLSKDKSESIFSKYSADSLKLTIRSVRFYGFDTIPEKFGVFKNVEHILIACRKNISGLDIFPKLKSVYFWGSEIEINPSEKWLNKIQGLYAEKSVVKGLQTFLTTPNLRDIYFVYARMEPFPDDFDKLKCLRRITLAAYRGDIDLSKIDLALNPCIDRVEFSTWYDAFSGIPKGLDTNRTFKLIINHQKLTKEEKKKLKTYNDRHKKASP